jgi:hypothetical protein
MTYCYTAEVFRGHERLEAGAFQTKKEAVEWARGRMRVLKTRMAQWRLGAGPMEKIKLA